MDKRKKPTLICTFVNKSRILGFVEFVKNVLHIHNISVFEAEHNEREYIVMFSTYRKLRFEGMLKHSRTMHYKNGSIFSINAINELIKQENGGNCNAFEYELDWEKYGKKLILLIDGKPNVDNLAKVDGFEVEFS